jgi:hypothetical protein
MINVIRLIGIICCGFGISSLFRPAILKKFLRFFKEGKRLYLAGLVRLVIGSIFLSGAPNCKIPAVLAILGLIIGISGILIFLFTDRIKVLLNYIEPKPTWLFHLFSILIFGFGVLVLYSA